MQKILRIKNVVEVTGLSRSTIYRLFNAGKFPRPIKLSERAIGWHESVIQNWIVEKADLIQNGKK